MQLDPPLRLFNWNFVLLWQGQLVSQLGNQAFLVAMMYWTMEATGSASVMGLLLMLSSLPSVLLSPLGGTLADHHSRRAIIIVSDVVRGLGVLVLAGVMFGYLEDTELILATLFAVSILVNIIGALFQPAISAAIPDLVPPSKLATANSVNRLSVKGSEFLGQATGGVLYQLLTAPVLFLIDGLTYLVSAISESFIQIPQELPVHRRGGGLREAFAVYLRETREGFVYVWHRPGMRDFLVTASAVNFFLAFVSVLLPFYATIYLSGGADWYGFLLAALSAGVVAGYVLAGSLGLAGTARSTTFICFLFGLAVTVLITGLTAHRPLALVLFFAMGVFTGTINIYLVTLLQSTTPGTMRGRVMGLGIAIGGAASPFGMGVAGLLGDLTGKNVSLIFGIASAAMILITLAASLRRPFREFLAHEIPGSAAGRSSSTGST